MQPKEFDDLCHRVDDTIAFLERPEQYPFLRCIHNDCWLHKDEDDPSVLEIGRIYTIKTITRLLELRSTVQLVEFPGKSFNPLNFATVKIGGVQ